MAPGCTVGWAQAGSSGAMLQVMFSWDNLGPIITSAPRAKAALNAKDGPKLVRV